MSKTMHTKLTCWVGALLLGGTVALLCGGAASGQGIPMAVVIGDIPDIVIGDEASVTHPNQFVYPDAVDLSDYVWKDPTAAAIRWSYEMIGTQLYSINGVAPLGVSDDPLNPGVKDINAHDLDPNKMDTRPATITVRDINLSPLGGPNAADPIIDHSQIVTFWASDGETVDSHTIVIWTNNDEPDRLSPECCPPWFYSQDFTSGHPGDFVYRHVAGIVTASIDARGICLAVPNSGVNIGQWEQTRNFLDLTPNSVFELRATMNTSQTHAEEVPFWDIVYDNYPGANSYGGDYFFLANEGGANAAGLGRTDFRMYFTPACILTPQFNNATTGAFTANNAPENDLRVYFRVLDYPRGYSAPTPGDVCMESIEIWKYDLADMEVLETIYSADTITPATHYVFSTEQATSATFSNGDVTLRPSDAAGWLDGGLVALNPGDNVLNIVTGVGVLDDFPVAWNGDELMLITCRLSGPNAAADWNPPDVIRIGADVPTTELLCTNLVTPNFHLLCTPKRPETVGNQPQDYIAFFYTHNETLSGLPNTHQLRPRFDIINVTELQANGFERNKGGVTLHSMKVQRVRFPGM